ncbi:MAG: 2-hydroxycarboxylate transporter family protein [Treponema sp.]|jgi:Na+/citrate or Na+/malate symporter|nr:2-hydroxycarboxylate transporter family protein [Treponema sp.]
MAEKTKWYVFKKVDHLFGIHIKFFLPIALIVCGAAQFEILPEGFVGSLAFLFAMGGILSWIGMITPIIREIGGFLILPLFGSSLLFKAGLISELSVNGAKLLMGNGFQMVFVSAIVVGSILALDRKILLASVIRYVPVLIISQVFALGFAFVSALITRTSFYDAVFFIAAPCMTGGTSGAVATLPALYSSILKTDMSALGGKLLAVAMIGEYIAVLFVVIMHVLANKYPAFMGNGNGELLQKESPALQEARKNWVPYENASLDYSELGGGFFLSLAVMVGGALLSKIIPQIVYVAWAIIICIAAKWTGFFSDKICRAANYWSQFAMKNIIVILVTALGLSSNSSASMASVFSFSTIVIIILTFIGAVLGAMFASRLFGLYRYEGALTAAMCSCNIGASGDLQMLTITNRLQLIAFATISTRIGGALMLLEISIIFPLVTRVLG